MKIQKYRAKKNIGQGLVEFALALPVFLLAVFGVIELSRFFLVYSSVYTASREATRYGSSVEKVSNIPHYLDCSGIKQAGMDVGFFAGLTANDIEIRYESSPSTENISSNSKFDNLTRTCEDYNASYLSNPERFFDITTGDRIVIRTIATYKPILGILPEMPVQAINGRTIMMDLDIQGISPGRPNTPTPYYAVPTATPNIAPMVVIEDNDLPVNEWLILVDYTTRFKDIIATVTHAHPENLIHTWSVVNGNSDNVSFSSTHTKDTTVEFATYGDYQFNLEVFDGQYTGSDTIWVLANAKPEITEVSTNADERNVSQSGLICGTSERLELIGYASDLHGGLLSYDWAYSGTSGVSFYPNQNQQFPRINSFPSSGDYTFTLHVTDGYIDADSFAPVSVHVNALPIVTASVVSAVPAVPKNTPVQLTGSATDSDGPIAITYQWVDVDNTGYVTFADTTAPITTASFSRGGRFHLQLIARDGCGEIGSNVIEVYVNQPPVVSAGADQILSSSTLTTNLTGIVTDDGFNVVPPVLTWTKDSGPGTATFTNASALSTQVTFSQPGTYVFRLTANDGWDSAFDTVIIKNNTAPIANAGSDQSIRSTGFATMNGSFLDPDVPAYQSISYLWTLVSGPGTVVFSNSTSQNPTVTFSMSGEYVLQLAVFDGLDYGYDTVTIRKNILPVASAGADRSAVINTNVILDGSASYDPDNIPNGGTLTYSWTVVSVPNHGAVNPTPPNPLVNPTVQFTARGVYVLRLTVSDGWETSSDDITITVTNN
ncbi:MAG: TadE family protein [Anaerolineaceae bacterium]